MKPGKKLFKELVPHLKRNNTFDQENLLPVQLVAERALEKHHRDKALLPYHRAVHGV